MKIVHVVAGAGIGGAETFCLDMIKALHERGIRQHVITRNHANYIAEFNRLNIPYTLLTFGPLRKWDERARIKSIIRSENPDIVHAWMGRASSFIPPGLAMPVMGWFGGYYDLKRYRYCDYYAGVTRDLVRHITEKSGHPDRVFLTHTFGTLEDMPPVDPATLATPADAKTVLLLSRMHWKKGIDTLLQAAKKLDGVYFWLAGDGPDIGKYQKMCADMGLNECVRFLGWRNDRAALLKSASVCVLPSRYEPFGTVIAEAWYAGVPLVAAKAAGARQYVTHDFDGLLCEIDDADGLAHQLHRALYDDALGAQLVENGRKTYNALFSKQVVVDAMIGAYATIIGRGKPSGVDSPAFTISGLFRRLFDRRYV